MENLIGANIRVLKVELSPKSEQLAKVTFELDFGEKRRKKPVKIAIWTTPEIATTESVLIAARKDMAKCLSLMSTLVKSGDDDWS